MQSSAMLVPCHGAYTGNILEIFWKWRIGHLRLYHIPKVHCLIPHPPNLYVSLFGSR